MADLLVDKVEVSNKDESILQIFLLTRNLEKWREQEEADKKLNFASDIFIVVGVIIGVCLGFHIGGGLGFGIGILCAFFSGSVLWAVVESILKATGKIVSEDGKLN